MSDSSNTEILCSSLLRTAPSAPSGPEFRAAVEKITPMVQSTVEKLCRRKSSRYSSPEDIQDVTQEVLIKLTQNPPGHKPQKFAEVTVLAWLKTTTVNLLTDKWRKDSYWDVGTEKREIRRMDVEDVGTVVEKSRDNTPRDIQRFEASNEIDDVTDYLERQYPKGAQLVKIMKNNPDCPPAELSEIMGVSVDNYYQIFKRTKSALSEYERVRRQAGGRR